MVNYGPNKGIILIMTFKENDVTCVVPTYQRPILLQRSLESIRSQTSLPKETIVVSNGVNSGVRNLVAQYENKGLSVRLIESNTVIPAWENWMNGFNQVSTHLIKIVWDDDWLEDNCIEELLKIMNSENADLVLCGAFGHVNGKKHRWYNLPDVTKSSFGELAKEVFRRQIPNSPLAGLHKTQDVLDAMNFLDYPEGAISENLVVGPDFAINLWGLLRGGRIAITSRPLVNMYSDGGNMTELNQNVLPSYYKYTIKALIKHFRIRLTLSQKLFFLAMPENSETLTHWLAQRLIKYRITNRLFP